ncbi:MAG: alkaline phosphatase family protein [Desulfobacterales bacterium]|nr:alkaline phosphatase family protein [Desulfobacterales bacterium]
MPSKCILILLDGLGDRSYEQLGHKTPLQAAKTPVLDRLTKLGANGLFHPTFQGQALPSENAHFMIFGHDMKDFPGRGALEALGYDVKLGENDVALLSHFVDLSESNGYFILNNNKPVLPAQEVAELTKAVKEFNAEGVTIRFNPTGGIRGILTFSGDVSPFITDTDPFIDGRHLIEPAPWADYQQDKASINAAKALKQYLLHVHQVLKDHPVNKNRANNGMDHANGMVTQRAGRLTRVEPFKEKYGLRGLMIASGPVYWGLGMFLGLDVEKVKDSDDAGSDMAHRLSLAHQVLEDYDFVHVHTKTPDEAAHTKDPLAKLKVIESLDKGIGKAIKPILDDPEVLVIVTADHSTPSSGLLVHSGESVPVTFVGEGVRRDLVKRFDEISTASGALGFIRGKELLYLILNHLDKVKLQGIMDTPVDQPYWPGEYEPFRVK